MVNGGVLRTPALQRVGSNPTLTIDNVSELVKEVVSRTTAKAHGFESHRCQRF